MTQIVCLHGLGRTPADWSSVRDPLATLGEVVAPQLPTRPDQALDLLDGLLSEDCVAIGHSMGAVLVGRLLAQRPRRLRAVVLSGCFFPPARNGRSTLESVRDYGRHRVALLRARRPERDGSPGLRAIAPLASLARQAIQPRVEEAALGRCAESVLMVHARDDHVVPVDFALAAAARNPTWSARILDEGGHSAHVSTPIAWCGVVLPWLRVVPA